MVPAWTSSGGIADRHRLHASAAPGFALWRNAAVSFRARSASRLQLAQ
jgi:hypothetical protein